MPARGARPPSRSGKCGWGARFLGPPDITVVEPLAARRDALAAAHPGLIVTAEAVAAAGAVIAVKPGDVAAACAALRGAGVPRVLSIAAGVPLATLEAALGEGVRVVRAMP